MKELKNGPLEPFLSIGFALVLTLSLLRNNNKKIKVDITKILTTVWLWYSIYYKDYFVMVICIIFLLFNLSSEEQ